MSHRPNIGEASQSGALEPLRQSAFRSIWSANLISNVGQWMQNVGAAWLMTSLSPSPTMVALVQAATNLPTFILSLPGGALADVVDRKRVLIATTWCLMIVTAALGVATLSGAIGAWSLLFFTLALGAAAALNTPAAQAIVPELVDRPLLPRAIALNSAGFNLARAVGPALGGLLVAAAGAGANFLVNAASFIVVLIALYKWRRPKTVSALPAEQFIGALRAGVRYVRHSSPVRTVLVRSFVFTICATALWALLPIIARRELLLGSLGYGLLLGCLGAGALATAFALPRFRTRMSVDKLVVTSTIIFAGASVSLVLLHNSWLIGLCLVAGGGAWLATLSSFNVAIQSSIPTWVSGRVLSVYQVVFSGSMAAGSIIWGRVAEGYSIPIAMLASSAALLLGLGAVTFFPLRRAEGIDVTTLTWPMPALAQERLAEDSAAFVTIEYLIEEARVAEFKKAMRGVREQRLRDGATRWTLLRQGDNPECFVEAFLVASWMEHLRQHTRVTVTDQATIDFARSFHIATAPPVVKHFLAERT